MSGSDKLMSTFFRHKKTLILLSGSDGDTRDLMVLLRPSLDTAAILPGVYDDECRKAAVVEPAMPRSIETEILSSIFCLYNIILSDSRNCAKELLDQISVLVRHDPFFTICLYF